jgi:cation diffusion facilitator family transporter
MISEAVHSTLDLFASIIAYLAVKLSDSPPDEDHPYGHGKYENISGVKESVLIFIAAIGIIYEAMHKFFSNGAVRSLEA